MARKRRGLVPNSFPPALVIQLVLLSSKIVRASLSMTVSTTPTAIAMVPWILPLEAWAALISGWSQKLFCSKLGIRKALGTSKTVRKFSAASDIPRMRENETAKKKLKLHILADESSPKRTMKWLGCNRIFLLRVKERDKGWRENSGRFNWQPEMGNHLRRISRRRQIKNFSAMNPQFGMACLTQSSPISSTGSRTMELFLVLPEKRNRPRRKLSSDVHKDLPAKVAVSILSLKRFSLISSLTSPMKYSWRHASVSMASNGWRYRFDASYQKVPGSGSDDFLIRLVWRQRLLSEGKLAGELGKFLRYSLNEYSVLRLYISRTPD